MRSAILALALAAPLSAVASTPTYGNPLIALTAHKPQPQIVFLTFVNYTSQEREVRIGYKQYAMRPNTVFHIYVPVGTVVSEYSNENSKIDGRLVLEVSAKDAEKSVLLK